MALPIRVKPALPLWPLLPGLVFPALLMVLALDLHGGGLNLLGRFALAAIHPSLDPPVISSLLKGLQVTLITALLAWGLSCLVGCALGLLSSRHVWLLLNGTTTGAVLIRRLLAPIRSLHELIWGLLLLQLFGLNGWVAVMAIALPYAALLARVVSDQIDSRNPPAALALQRSGAGPGAAFVTAVLPSVGPTLMSHMAQRLDCALRSAVLLGVFGLGGLGTDLLLSLQSLQFREIWSGLWILAIAMGALEVLLSRFPSGMILLLLSAALPAGLLWGSTLEMDLTTPQLADLSFFQAVDGAALMEALTTPAWPALILSTVALTLLASAVAISGPVLGLILWPGRSSVHLQRWGWGLLRLLPPPLTALLLLMMVKPSLWLAGLALGLHHLGVMGRILVENLDHNDPGPSQALRCMGAGRRQTWLMGELAPCSRSYLIYAASRCDVILRDTAVVGLVGGAGLGWQLIEALSSFHWALVFWLVLAYATLTSLGELLMDRLQRHWACQADSL